MLLNHSLIYVGARLSSGICGLATTILLTHLLSPAQFGFYGLALVVMMFITNSGFDGLGMTFSRYGRENNRDDLTKISTFVFLFLALMTACVGIVALGAGTGLIPYAKLDVVILGMLLAWSYSIFELATRFEAANLRPMTVLTMTVTRAAMVLALAVGLAWATKDPAWAILGTVLGTLIGAMMGRFPLSSVHIRYFDHAFAWKVVGFCLPLAAGMFLDGLTMTGIRILVQLQGSIESLGQFTAAYLVVQTTLTVIGAGIGSAGYQLAIRALNDGDEAEYRRQLIANSALLIAIMAPASLGMAITADALAQSMFSPEYSRFTAPLIPWLAMGTFFGVIRAFHLDQVYQLERQSRRQLPISFAAAALTNALAFALIPSFGALGAAMALGLAMPISCVHSYLAGRSVMQIPLPVSAIIRIAICCAVMTVPVMAISGSGMIILAGKIAGGMLAYCIAALALNVLGVRDRAIAYVSKRPT